MSVETKIREEASNCCKIMLQRLYTIPLPPTESLTEAYDKVSHHLYAALDRAESAEASAATHLEELTEYRSRAKNLEEELDRRESQVQTLKRQISTQEDAISRLTKVMEEKAIALLRQSIELNKLPVLRRRAKFAEVKVLAAIHMAESFLALLKRGIE